MLDYNVEEIEKLLNEISIKKSESVPDQNTIEESKNIEVKIIHNYDSKIDLEENSYEKRIEKAIFNEKLLQYDEAILCYEEAIKIKPTGEAYFGKANSLRNQINYEDALEFFKSAANLDSKYQDDYNKYAKGLVILKRLKAKLNKKNDDYKGGSLDLMNYAIGPDGINILSKCINFSKLTWLNLNKNNLGDIGMNYFKRCSILSNLTWLCLNNNNIGEAGFNHFSNCSYLGKLTWLYLDNNNMGEVGMHNFSKCSFLNKLTRLNLENNNIGDEGINSLTNCSFLGNIIGISLCDNNIKDKSTLEALLNNKSIFPKLEEKTF